MIVIANDHAAVEMKNFLIEYLKEQKIDFCDLGTNDSASCNYAEYGILAARYVAEKKCDKGIVICGTGIGISIAANKVKGIRCANCTNVFMAEMSRRHNNANMLALGARILDKDTMLQIVKTFLNTEFEGGRHQARLDRIEQCENNLF